MIVFRSPAHLDILEVVLRFRILSEVDVGREQLDEACALHGELLVVFGGDLDHNLQLLSDVSDKHHLQTTLKEVFNGQGAEIVDQPLLVEHVGVYNSTLKGSRENS